MSKIVFTKENSPIFNNESELKLDNIEIDSNTQNNLAVSNDKHSNLEIYRCIINKNIDASITKCNLFDLSYSTIESNNELILDNINRLILNSTKINTTLPIDNHICKVTNSDVYNFITILNLYATEIVSINKEYFTFENSYIKNLDISTKGFYYNICSDSITFSDDTFSNLIYMWYGATAFFTGSSIQDESMIQYVNMSTESNTSFFADLYCKVERHQSTSNGTIGLNIGGSRFSNPSIIDKFIFAINSDSTYWCDISAMNGTSCSDGIIALFGAGGSVGGAIMRRLTFAIQGVISEYIDVTHNYLYPGGCSDGTIGIFGGGWAAAPFNYIDQFLFVNSTGMTDFGDLTVARSTTGACSDRTIGIFGGGYNYTSVIDYITISVMSNATNFGDLTIARCDGGTCSNGTRALWGGGRSGDSYNVIDYITFSNKVDATDFGDLLYDVARNSGCSGN